MTKVTFIGGPLNGTVCERRGFPICLKEDGVTNAGPQAFQRRKDIYLRQHRNDPARLGKVETIYVHATLPLNSGGAR